MINLVKSINRAFNQAKAVYFPEVPALSELSTGLCVLPMPKIKAKAAPKQEVTDAYIEVAETNTWGFMSNRATDAHDGSVSVLTSFDIDALVERGLWGKEKTKRGDQANARTARCKALWHDGRMVNEVCASTGMSATWVEHRFAAFNAALLAENSQNQ